MKIVITGAGGFVGAHLVPAALRAGHDVVAVARQPGTIIDPHCRWALADLSRPGWTDALPRQADAVVHLAQSRRFREFPDGAPDMFAVNTQSTAELLEWARGAGVRRFVLASTGSVYGERDEPLTEDDAVAGTGFYAATKLAAEELTRAYASLFSVAVARLFGPYGPGQQGMLMANMIDRVRSGDEVQLAGGTGPVMSPVYVADCVEALLCLVAAEGPAWRVYNVAGSERVTLADIVAAIAGQAGVAPRTADGGGTARSVAASNARLRTELGWTPSTPLADGLRKTLTGRS